MAPAPIDLWRQGSNLVDRVRNYYVKDKEPAPLISQRTAFLCAALFTLFYIAPFYLSPTLRTSALNSRDAPVVIRARVRAVGLTCLACMVGTVYVLVIYGHATPTEVLRLCGIWPVDLLDILKALALVVVLFTCSLYESIVVDADWRDWSPAAFKEGIWDSWTGYRNLVIAPISEELVFRALTVPLFLLAKTSPARIVFLTPLIFGLAHLHHLFAFIQARTPEGQRLPPLRVVIQGLVVSLFQFTYTSIFGFFATFVFVRTGNIWAAIVAHSFCNYMGLPRLWGRVGQYVRNGVPSTAVTPDASPDKKDDDGPLLAPQEASTKVAQDDGKAAVQDPPANLGLAWTVVYYALVPVGAFAFYKLLYPLTASSNSLISI